MQDEINELLRHMLGGVPGLKVQQEIQLPEGFVADIRVSFAAEDSKSMPGGSGSCSTPDGSSIGLAGRW